MDVLAYLFFGYDFMYLYRFGNDVADGHTGRQTGVRILKNQLHIRAVFPHGALFDMGDILALEPDLSAVAFVQLQNRSAQRGLAAARFPYDAQRFAALNGKRHVVHRFQRAQRLAENAGFDGEIFL